MTVKIWKRLVLTSLLVLFLFKIWAQTIPNQTSAIPAALNTREVSGLITDSTDVGIANISVKLISSVDTLLITTNSEGVFRFSKVKSATYLLSISSVGFKPFIGKFKQNDAIPRIVMDPITLEAETNRLNEVVIKGKPTIIYKTDTVEYTAADYKVRANATIDELLKKMEGMEVSRDGSLYQDGKEVTKAKINGKVYLGGDIASTIQNLPAEIVEKIQIINDYGDQAARTGIKDGDPNKTLNIVTRVDKSVGNTAILSGGAGNNDRYEGSVFGSRLNGDRTIGFTTKLNNTVNGVANNGFGLTGNTISANANPLALNSSSESGGTTKSGTTILSFNDQLSKNISINANYSYSFNNPNTSINSVTQFFSSLGTTISAKQSMEATENNVHNLKFEIEADLNKYNFLRVTPTFNYAKTSSNTQYFLSQTGLINQDQRNNNFSQNNRPNLGGIIFYQRSFKKQRRNLSLQLGINYADQEFSEEALSRITYLQLTNNGSKDSLAHNLIDRENEFNSYRTSITFIEPLNVNSQLEFNGQLNWNRYDNLSATRNKLLDGSTLLVDSLSNNYSYFFNQARLTINYRYGVSVSKFKYSLGLIAIPTTLGVSLPSVGLATSKNSLYLIPMARFQYVWSARHNIQLNYYGSAIEPTVQQIQPFSDISNTQNPIIGNPNLKPAFNHVFNSSYSNYIPNSQLSITLNMNAAFLQDAIVRNNNQIVGAYSSLKNETRFANVDGAYRLNSNFNLSKQLNNRKYVLAYTGNASYINGVSLSNYIPNTTSTWQFVHRVGPKINPFDWLEINPNFTYVFIKSSNSLSNSVNSKVENLAFNVDGRVFLSETWTVGFSVSKNYVSGISANISNNPFIANVYVQTYFWRKRASLTLEAFDIAKQNNFINRIITDESITDIESNVLSRYCMLKFRINLQKWTSYKEKKGQPIMRRGDGSFN